MYRERELPQGKAGWWGRRMYTAIRGCFLPTRPIAAQYTQEAA